MIWWKNSEFYEIVWKRIVSNALLALIGRIQKIILTNDIICLFNNSNLNYIINAME